jgi:glucan phosphoethanolaminetransferase (alkaline phosphatase superfamily)
VFYTVFPILFIALTALSFYKYSQDIIVSKNLIEAVSQTSLLVSLDLISIRLVLGFIIVIILLYYLFKLYKKVTINQLKSPLTIFAILGICTYFLVEKKRSNTFKSRMPYVVFYSIKDYLSDNTIQLLDVPDRVKANKEDAQLIFILGESVRADHLQLNGYKRETTPLLSSRKNVISFSKLYTKYTHTVPCIMQLLTNRSILDTIEKNKLYSVFSILNKANYDTFWIANSTLVSSYEPIIKSNKHVKLIDKFRSIMSFNKALDEKMLQPFDSVLNNTHNAFIGLHMVGSHWWYENRYSDKFRKFRPVIQSKYIPSLKKEEIINSYDNTILYLDNFINEVIKKAEKQHQKTIVLYVSDHGEILGEDGKWLHAQNNIHSKNPAMLLWYSNEFAEQYPAKIKNLKANASKRITTDFLFNTFLDFYNIENFNFDRTKSILNPKMNFNTK